MANSRLLFHWTLFDREYPHPLNDFFGSVYNLSSPKSLFESFIICHEGKGIAVGDVIDSKPPVMEGVIDSTSPLIWS